MRGWVVLSIGYAHHSDDDPAIRERVVKSKASLDLLHKQKIDMADAVAILNVGKYIGESTRSELAYSRAAGKPVYWLVWPEDKDVVVGDRMLVAMMDDPDMGEAFPQGKLQSRLLAFAADMRAEFYAVRHKHQGDHRHGALDVCDDATDWSKFDWSEILSHYFEESQDLERNLTNVKNWVDVANMAFLMGYHFKHAPRGLPP